MPPDSSFRAGEPPLPSIALEQLPPPGAPGGPRTGVDIPALNAFLQSVHSYDADHIYGPAEGQPLFHYTDLGGLLGISQHHDLWLTHSRYSNDDEEVLHGYRAAQEVIAAALAAAPDPVRADYLRAVEERLRAPAPEGVYICCFCQTDDLLSQWRSYGANGTGVSISLDPREFSHFAGPDSPHGGLMRLWKVFYEPARQKRIIQAALDFFFGQWGGPPDERARRAADAIQFFIPTFKNPGFQEESECRLIFTPPPGCPVPPRFRVARGMLIPYFSLKDLLGGFAATPYRLPIIGVRVGPSAQKTLNVESARMLLAAGGYGDKPVTASDTPYRG